MRFEPEEFVVEEIASDGAVLERDTRIERDSVPADRDYFTHFVLQKRLWTTTDALRALSKRVHAKQSRFNYAGTKDRNAITTQLCSAFCIPPNALLNARLKDVKILGAWKAREKVGLGDLLGNRFTITLTKENAGVQVDAAEVRGRALKRRFPNYFGAQRFGSVRRNTALVGEHLLRGDAKSAVINYLTFVEGERSEEALAARKRLAAEPDFAAALQYFPRWLKNERVMLSWLAEHETDFAGAMRCLPRGLQLLFVHAVQSRLFNDELAAGPSGEEGSLVGYETTGLTEFEENWLKERGLTKDSFKLASFPELSCKGGKRGWFAELNGFKVLGVEPLIVRFSLGAGCYATQAIKFLVGLGE